MQHNLRTVSATCACTCRNVMHALTSRTATPCGAFITLRECAEVTRPSRSGSAGQSG
jgi:hypothetical protein